MKKNSMGVSTSTQIISSGTPPPRLFSSLPRLSPLLCLSQRSTEAHAKPVYFSVFPFCNLSSIFCGKYWQRERVTAAPSEKMRNTHLFVATLMVLALLVISSVMQIANLDQRGQFLVNLEGTETRSVRLRNQVKKVCLALNISSPISDFQLSNMLVDEQTMTLYCSVPKVASTTMKRVFLRLTNAISSQEFDDFEDRDFVHSHPLLQPLYLPKYANKRSNILASYRKLLYVRNPLARVVSTYRDKVERYTGQERVNFPQYLAAKLKEKFGLSLRHNGNEEDLVTFRNFVKLIVAQDDHEAMIMDPHWRSIHETCNPCAIPYDFIGQFERLPEDEPFLLRWLGPDRALPRLPTDKYRNGAAQVTRCYFSNLDAALKLSFFAKYFLDYVSFDYEFCLSCLTGDLNLGSSVRMVPGLELRVYLTAEAYTNNESTKTPLSDIMTRGAPSLFASTRHPKCSKAFILKQGLHDLVYSMDSPKFINLTFL
ncbi:carbohydrate sulfotransferase 11-like [Penaeus chinensis]|uniref:carbohydrate sulfotransferase 11-like n=1 Tax=Penaeus chinensis TaxID=139456 RepID=UPI001FB685A5|nr:carbohydrate sulfotransferase 11-like [Penaeus chinensis]